MEKINYLEDFGKFLNLFDRLKENELNSLKNAIGENPKDYYSILLQITPKWIESSEYQKSCFFYVGCLKANQVLQIRKTKNTNFVKLEEILKKVYKRGSDSQKEKIKDLIDLENMDYQNMVSIIQNFIRIAKSYGCNTDMIDCFDLLKLLSFWNYNDSSRVKLGRYILSIWEENEEESL